MDHLTKNDLAKADFLKPAFTAVKYDISNLESDLDSFKKSTDEWLIFLDQTQRKLIERLERVERKLSAVESREMEKVSLLR